MKAAAETLDSIVAKIPFVNEIVDDVRKWFFHCFGIFAILRRRVAKKRDTDVRTSV